MEMKERAMQCYMVLLSAAHNRQILTYELVGQLIDLPARAMGKPLGYVMAYCSNHDLPPLTVLVVRKGEGAPGEGLATADPDEFNENCERVFTREWYKDVPITPDILVDEWKKYCDE